LFGSELSGAAASFLVAQQIYDRRFQIVIGDVLGRHRGQLVVEGSEAKAPPRHSLSVNVEQLRHRHCRLPLGAAEHHLDTFRKPPLERSASSQLFKDRSLSRKQLD
jgi:hypothetical protein